MYGTYVGGGMGWGPDETLARSRQEHDLLYAAKMKWYYLDELALELITTLADEFRSDGDPFDKYGKDEYE